MKSSSSMPRANSCLSSCSSIRSIRIEDGILVDSDEVHDRSIECAVIPPADNRESDNTLSPTSNGVRLELSSMEDDYNIDEADQGEALNISSLMVNEKTGESLCELDSNGRCLHPGKKSTCVHSLYGKPLSKEKIKEIIADIDPDHKDGGLLWKIKIVPTDFDRDYKQDSMKNKVGKLRMLDARNYDTKNQCIKPRRGELILTWHDFVSSLTVVDGYDEEHEDDQFEIYRPKTRYFFSGVLNGWPALTCLEVLQIEYKRTLQAPGWRTHWDTNDDNYKDVKPSFPSEGNMNALVDVRATVRSPSWTAFGWSRESLGYVFWYEGFASREKPRLTYGENILRVFEKDALERWKEGKLFTSPRCVNVHHISHRYATGDKTGVKDLLTYHSFALLEWDHGKYCTVVELAWLQGLSGSNGRSNWVEDKKENTPHIYKCMPPEMIGPWKNLLSEIRCTDVKAKTVKEHLLFMNQHTGKHDRFVDVHHTFSHAVRLSFNTKEHIAQYLINYIRRGRTYSEIRRNCQTFAADFCAFLAGKKDVQPFHPINKQMYRNQTHFFLYDSTMYRLT